MKLHRGWIYLIGVIGLRGSDIILASFPRSGNTWIRSVLFNYACFQEYHSTVFEFHQMNSTMPELGFSNLLKQWPYQSIPRFVKTHRPFNPIIFFRRHRILHIIRDPRDVMVSYYHFLKLRKFERFKGNFPSFIRHPKYGLRQYFHHYFSWEPKVTALVRFEELKASPLDVLQQLFYALDIPVNVNLLRRAIEQSSFERAQKIVKKSGFPDPNRFDSQFNPIRKGSIRQWIDYFTDEDIAYYRSECEKFKFDLYK